MYLAIVLCTRCSPFFNPPSPTPVSSRPGCHRSSLFIVAKSNAGYERRYISGKKACFTQQGLVQCSGARRQSSLFSKVRRYPPSIARPATVGFKYISVVRTRAEGYFTLNQGQRSHPRRMVAHLLHPPLIRAHFDVDGRFPTPRCHGNKSIYKLFLISKYLDTVCIRPPPSAAAAKSRGLI